MKSNNNTDVIMVAVRKKAKGIYKQLIITMTNLCGWQLSCIVNNNPTVKNYPEWFINYHYVFQFEKRIDDDVTDVGATCVKDEKHENAVKLLNLIIEYDIQNWEEWVWIEASGKIEEIFRKYGGFNVPTKYVKIFLRSIPFDLVDEYHYSRNIGGNMETKTIFGFKDESTFEFLKKEITDKVNAFINRTKINESLSNSEEEIEQIWNRFSKNENEIEKDRDIINFFVYLKDDELINEFPKECLDLLKKSITNIQRVLESGNYDIKKEKQYRLTVEEGLRVISTSTVLEPLKMIA